MTGWVCPKCGASWAPFVHQCQRCNGPMLTGTGIATVPPCVHDFDYERTAPACRYCGAPAARTAR